MPLLTLGYTFPVFFILVHYTIFLVASSLYSLIVIQFLKKSFLINSQIKDDLDLVERNLSSIT